MGKVIGSFNGVEVYSDPNVPKGIVYMIDNNDWTHANCSCQVIILSRWQRFKYWFRKQLKKLKDSHAE